MKELVDWLKTIEERAFLLYEFSAKAFAKDAALKKLLLHLAEEERLHYELLSRAEVYMKETPAAPAFLSLNDIKDVIEKPFIESSAKARAGTLGKSELLRYITEIEYSELNSVFLYLVDSLKDRSPIFCGAAENIRIHRGCIEKYMQTQPDTSALIKKIKELPTNRSRTILVVDDKPANVNLLKSILAPIGAVEGASNGLDALKKVMLRRFSAIVTDVDMPRMSGTEFYSRTVKMLPHFSDKFIFYTGSPNETNINFFRANNLKYIIKPASIHEIRRTVNETVAAEKSPAQRI